LKYALFRTEYLPLKKSLVYTKSWQFKDELNHKAYSPTAEAALNKKLHRESKSISIRTSSPTGGEENRGASVKIATFASYWRASLTKGSKRVVVSPRGTSPN
jgi:hypothetical protein